MLQEQTHSQSQTHQPLAVDASPDRAAPYGSVPNAFASLARALGVRPEYQVTAEDLAALKGLVASQPLPQPGHSWSRQITSPPPQHSGLAHPAVQRQAQPHPATGQPTAKVPLARNAVAQQVASLNQLAVKLRQLNDAVHTLQQRQPKANADQLAQIQACLAELNQVLGPVHSK